MSLDLGFGNSNCVREAFIHYRSPISINDSVLSAMDYPPYGGDPALIELTKEVILRQTGQQYEHVVLTNGATGAVVTALRMYSNELYEYCITRDAPYYLRYPEIIRTTGMMQMQQSQFPHDLGRAVTLVDMPSNPLGKLDHIYGNPFGPTIVDGVYLNRVYMSLAVNLDIRHEIMVGSYSKLLGINGIRVGWAATNSAEVANKLMLISRAEHCGLSVASSVVLSQSLRNFYWEAFEKRAKGNLDSNRSEWSKLERFFGETKVGANGMFYFAPIDKHCRKLLEKSEIIWTTGSSLGANDNYGRFNLGQYCNVIGTAVKAIRKNDRISRGLRSERY